MPETFKPEKWQYGLLALGTALSIFTETSWGMFLSWGILWYWAFKWFGPVGTWVGLAFTGGWIYIITLFE